MEQALTRAERRSWSLGEEVQQALIRVGVSEAHQRLPSQIFRWPVVLPPLSAHAAAATSPPLLAQGPHDDTAASAPLALVPVGMDNNPSEALGDRELPNLAMYSQDHIHILNQGYTTTYTTGDTWGQNQNHHQNLLQGLAASPPHVLFITISSGGRRSRNNGLPAADDDLAGGQAHRAADDDLEAGRRQGHPHPHRGAHLLPVVVADDGAPVMWGRTYTRRKRARDVRLAAERADRAVIAARSEVGSTDARG